MAFMIWASPAWRPRAGVAGRSGVRALAVRMSESVGYGMDAVVTQVVADIHRSPIRAALGVAGGGGQSVAWLLGVPGASQTVLDVAVPYARESLQEFCDGSWEVGNEMVSFAGVDAAKAAARTAFRRAAALAPMDTPFCGVGATCALVSASPKKGEHRCAVAIEGSAGNRKTFELQFKKDVRTRWEEDAVVSRMVIWALATQEGLLDIAVKKQLIDCNLKDQETVIESEIQDIHNNGYIEELMSKDHFKCLEVNHLVGHTFSNAPRRRKVILSGSFNPLHSGHKELLAAGCKLTGLEGFFEFSALNADKGHLNSSEVERRIAQFQESQHVVVVTKKPLFTEKAAIFRGCTFLVGYDTAVRLIQARYYNGSEKEMLSQFEMVRQHGCDFLVAGRVAKGSFLGMDQIEIPAALSEMFKGIPESVFRNDISSTALRRQAVNSDET